MRTLGVFLVFVLTVCSVSGALGQVTLRASAKGTVATGQQFRLTYELNENGSGFDYPDFSPFTLVSGPSQSSSTSISIVNGRTTKQVSFTYTFILQATREGKLTIQPASIVVNGQTVTSNPVTIHVVKGQQPTTANPSGAEPSPVAGIGNEDIFIKVFADKDNPYQGEEVIVRYVLYTRVNISSYGISKMPNAQGFWSKTLTKENQQARQSYETINGEQYLVAELHRIALYPQKSGRLTLSAMEAEFQVRVKTNQARSNDPFDNFFRNSFFDTYQNVKKEVKSGVLAIQVKPWPSAQAPDSFGNTVGVFKLSSSIDKTEVKENEAVNLKFTYSGQGNIELIEAPDVQFPPDLEAYDPKVTTEVKTALSGVSGSKSFEYVVIPRAAGRFKIKPVTFCFFNPSTKKFVTLTSDAFEISVLKGDGSQTHVVVSNISKEDIQFIGSDIRHIIARPFQVTKAGDMFYLSALFWGLLAVPFVLFVVFIVVWRKELQKRSNKQLMRSRKSTKVAMKRLKTAVAFLKQNKRDEFYVEFSRALWGYMGDKFSIPLADLSLENIHDALMKKAISRETIDLFVETLNNCEFDRFAPHAGPSSMEQIYQSGIHVITKIEKELK